MKEIEKVFRGLIGLMNLESLATLCKSHRLSTHTDRNDKSLFQPRCDILTSTRGKVCRKRLRCFPKRVKGRTTPQTKRKLAQAGLKLDSFMHLGRRWDAFGPLSVHHLCHSPTWEIG